MLTYDQFLPNITGIIQKHWNLLQRKKKKILKKDLQELFEEELITAFKKNKNLKELIQSTSNGKGKVKKLNK